MSKGGRYLQKSAAGKKFGGLKKGLLIALIVFLVLVIAIVALVVGIYKDKIGRINIVTPETKEYNQEEIDNILSYVPSDSIVEDPVTSTDPTTEPTTVPTVAPTEDPTAYEEGKLGKIVNIMLVGQSWRPGEEGKMSDTMILFTVNKQTKTLTLTSFMRDTYVKLANYKDSGGTQHSCGSQRLNVAYALGYSWGGAYDAMGMLNQTIEENFLIDIDYNVEIDFDTFVKVIDTLGGIEVELDADEAKYLQDSTFCWGDYYEGNCLLDGYGALAYARIRSSNASDSDENRTARQRRVIEKIVGKLKGLSLTELNALIDTILPMITTNMPEDVITSCIVELLPLLPKLKIASHLVPMEGKACGQYREIYGVNSGVLVPNLYKNQEALRAICEDVEVVTE